MSYLSEKTIEIYEKYTDTFSGSFLVADRDGIIFATASGFANRDFAILNKTDTRFDTVSVTKAFTAAAMLQLKVRRFCW